MAAVDFRVTPQVLVSRANDAAVQINSMKNILASIKRTVQSTKSYWKGPASEACRAQYEKQQNSIEAIMARLEKQPKTLSTIAVGYDVTEQNVIAESASLPTEVIS